jgi:hypothetical protein
MKQVSKALITFLFISAFVSTASAQASLYKRLGGYDAIAAVTDDFIGRLVADKNPFALFCWP